MNADRFPPDFVFQLTAQENAQLMSKFIASNGRSNRSQIVTGSQKHRDPRFLPYAFTEHGAIMAANILNSQRAVQMSVFVVRAFVKMRRQMLSRSEMERRLLEIERILLEHNDSIRDLYEKIVPLLLPPHNKPRKQIGFTAKEKLAKYAATIR